MLSLTASFGALVWVFQDGNLGAFGTTATGTMAPQIPALLFCLAFGLSMDYEVFLISRIREHWLASRRRTSTTMKRSRSASLVPAGWSPPLRF